MLLSRQSALAITSVEKNNFGCIGKLCCIFLYVLPQYCNPILISIFLNNNYYISLLCQCYFDLRKLSLVGTILHDAILHSSYIFCPTLFSSFSWKRCALQLGLACMTFLEPIPFLVHPSWTGVVRSANSVWGFIRYFIAIFIVMCLYQKHLLGST